MNNRSSWCGFALGLLVLSACGGDDGDEATASAAIAPATGQTATGTVAFTSSGGQVSATVNISSATAGVHGMHIHHTPDCSMDGAAAGGHWNGTEAAGDANTHGLPDAATHHVGDLGNITIAADGTGTLTHTNSDWKLGDGSLLDVIDHAIIFHALQDDGSMPSAGGRFACGIITAD